MSATIHTRLLGRKVEVTLEQYGDKYYPGRIANVYMSGKSDLVLYDIEVDGDPDPFLVSARVFTDGMGVQLRMRLLSAK